ncbi:hypothetical protein HDZ31DRAFT_40171 [Schizophyllum fasciatum]
MVRISGNSSSDLCKQHFGQSSTATRISRTLHAVYPHVGTPIPPRILTPSLTRELRSCLSPARIPSHPLSAADAETISEAMDAIFIYARFVANIQDSPRSFEDALFAALPDVWQWVMFVSPRSGNVAHEEVPLWLLKARMCQLRHDGYAAIPLQFLVKCLTMIVGVLGQHARGDHALLARPGFPAVVFDFFTYDIARPVLDTAWDYHKFFFVINSLIQSGHPAMVARMRAEVLLYDEKYPGLLICTICHRLAWFLDPTIYRLDPSEETSYVESYGTFFTLEFMNTHDTIAHIQQARPTRFIVGLLVRATARSEWLEGPPYRILIARLWFAILNVAVIAGPTTSASYPTLILALRHGILLVTHRILCTVHSERAACPYTEDCKNEALRFIEETARALVWRKVLREFDVAFERDHSGALRESDPREWEVLIKRYSYYRSLRAHLKEQICPVLERCANPQVSSPCGLSLRLN